jgi:N-acetylglucosaminyl transferase component (Gpi1)
MPQTLVLAWPQDPHRMVVPESQKSSRTLVGVGWQTTVSSSCSAMATIVALGLIPLNDNDDNDDDDESPTVALLEQVNAVRARLRQISVTTVGSGDDVHSTDCHHCHVCLSSAAAASRRSDDNPNDQRRAAVGSGCCCHNALLYRSSYCWTSLDVVFLVEQGTAAAATVDDADAHDNVGYHGHDNLLQLLPRVSISARGFPIVRQRDNPLSFAVRPVQVLLYPRQQHYLANNLMESAARNQQEHEEWSALLVRLTYASTVWQGVERAWSEPMDAVSVEPAKAAMAHSAAAAAAAPPCLVSYSLVHPPSRSTGTLRGDPLVEDASSNLSMMERVTRWILQHSLLARHLGQENGRGWALWTILCYYRCIVSKPRPKYVDCVKCQTRANDRAAAVSAAVDILVGLALGALVVALTHARKCAFELARTPPPPPDSSLPMMVSFEYQFLSASRQWLERNPLGIKLNQRLLENVGAELQRLWNVHEWMAGHAFVWSRPFWSGSAILIGLCGATMGGSGLAALSWDVIRVCSWHITAVAWLVRQVYGWELHLLAALWRLFRGRKRNILRRGRTDSKDYDYMQLLLGTLLFAVALFLFTTIFVYHAFFTVLNLALLVAGLPLVATFHILLGMPWSMLWLRWRHPTLFTRDVFLVDVVDHDLSSDDTVVTQLEPRFRSYTSIIATAFLPPTKAIASWLVRFTVESFSGSGPSAILLDAVLSAAPNNSGR